ncbi:hypothetical protein [uncultured Campylobacter sp.]|uniref:hypothetical protein n=1 Tax=uncultured Campylobacter sp. TaxID=218934 RepID=UPI0026217B91|nr:hypothetical protein [uncultured Campylobacter sp.]
MDKILSGAGKINGADKISSVAGTCGRALNLRGVVHGAVQNGSFDCYRFDRT